MLVPDAYWVRIMVALFGELAVHKTLQIGTYTHHEHAEHAKHDQKRPKDAPKVDWGPILVPKRSTLDAKVEAKTDPNTKTLQQLKSCRTQ